MKKLLQIACASLCVALTVILFAACKTKNKSNSNEILGALANNLSNTYSTHSTIDFDAVTITLTYANKTTKTLTKGEIDIDVEDAKADTEFILLTSGLSAQTGGELEEETYAISVYVVETGKTYNLSNLPTITVTNNLSGFYDIVSFDAPAFVTTYKSNSAAENISNTDGTKFYQTASYYVGAQNGFVIKPTLTVSSKNDSSYLVPDDYNVTVTVNGTAVVNGGDYDDFSYDNFTFYFKSSAIDENKSFAISILPADYETNLSGDPIKAVTLTVKVGDGYNVYNAVDLGRINLVSESIVLGQYNRHTENKIFYDETNNAAGHLVYKDTSVIWKAFLEQKVEEGIIADDLAPVNGIFIHGDIIVTAADLPADYFITTAEATAHSNAALEGTLRDYSFLYNHYMENDFTFNGNLFSINFSGIKVGLSIIESDEHDDTQKHLKYYTSTQANFEMGHSTAFVFTGKNNQLSYQVANFINTNLTGNIQENINSENDTVIKQASGGLILLKAISSEVKATNNLSRLFFIGYYSELNASANFEVNGVQKESHNGIAVDHCKILDNYTSAVYSWCGQNNTITNSLLDTSGGPSVFLIDRANYINNNYVNNDPASWVIDDATVIDNDLIGSESWFTLTDTSQLATALKNLDQLLSGYGKTIISKTNDKDSSIQYMNILALGMDCLYQGSEDKHIDVSFTYGNWEYHLTPEVSTTYQGLVYVNSSDGSQITVSINQQTGAYSPASAPTGTFQGDKLVILHPMNLAKTYAVIILQVYDKSAN